MKVSIVAVGNSRGVRLPKAVIDQCGFGAEVDMAVEDGRVVLSRVATAREGWAEAFDAMAAAGDGAALLPEDANAAWDDAEWRW